MKVSVVISCYNEKDTIEKIVEAVGNAPLADRENRGGHAGLSSGAHAQKFLWDT